jgi:hypothetical protein
VIDIAQGDDALARAALNIAPPHAADADLGNAKRVARSLVAGAAEDVAGDDESAESHREVAARGFIG